MTSGLEVIVCSEASPSFHRPNTYRSAPNDCGDGACNTCLPPASHSKVAGVTTRSPSTTISSPGGFVEIVVAVGGIPYIRATPSISPSDNHLDDLIGMPGGIDSIPPE